MSTVTNRALSPTVATDDVTDRSQAVSGKRPRHIQDRVVAIDRGEHIDTQPHNGKQQPPVAAKVRVGPFPLRLATTDVTLAKVTAAASRVERELQQAGGTERCATFAGSTCGEGGEGIHRPEPPSENILSGACHLFNAEPPPPSCTESVAARADTHGEG